MPQANTTLTTQRAKKPQFGQLGASLRATWRAYAENRPAYEAACARFEKLLFDCFRTRKISTRDYFEGKATKVIAELEKQANLNGPGGVDETSFDAHAAVRETLRTATPQTLSDLAVLANACAAANVELWRDHRLDDLDDDIGWTRRLVEAVLHVAGEDLLFSDLPMPQTLNQYALTDARNLGL